jgi:hypothetical protein
MSENTDRIEEVQGMLSEMATLMKVYEDGVDVGGEVIEASQQAKQRFRQRLNAARVGCVTTLNQIAL